MVCKKIRLACALVLASCALAAPSSAWATREVTYLVRPGGRISATSLGSLRFTSAFYTVTCPVTLGGEWLSEQIWSEVSAGMARIESGSVGTCSSGSARVETSNRWALTFSSFSGTLPNLTAMQVRIVDFSMLFTVNVFGVPTQCKYTGEVGASFALSGTGPYTTGLLSILERGQSFTVATLSGFCPGGESVLVAGGFTFTSTTLTQRPFVELQPVPRTRPFGSMNGDQIFTFTNVSGAGITLTEVAIIPGYANFRIGSVNTCLMPDGSPRLIPNMGECRVRVDFLSSGANTEMKISELRLYRGAAGMRVLVPVSPEISGR
jgi:hypothetical protein